MYLTENKIVVPTLDQQNINDDDDNDKQENNNDASS